MLESFRSYRSILRLLFLFLLLLFCFHFFLFLDLAHVGAEIEIIYGKSSIKPPGGLKLFQAHLRWGGGGVLNGDGGLFNLEKTMVSVIHKKKPEYEVETLKYKKLEVTQPRIKNKSSPNEVLQL